MQNPNRPRQVVPVGERFGFVLSYRFIFILGMLETAFFYLTFGLHNDSIVLGCKSEVSNLPEQKKMGRPTDNPKGTSIHVRLDDECVEILEKYCTQEKVGRAEATRRAIIRLKDKLIKK